MTLDVLLPVHLQDLGAADLQRRTDRRYLLASAALDLLASALADTHRVLSVEGRRSFRYRSSYLDTPELACFHDHRRGRRLRWKARTRLYADTGLCRFEVKTKTGRGATAKHAVEVSAADFGGVPPAGRQLLARVLAEQCREEVPPVLLPSLLVDYRRTTLVAADRTSRATIDSDLVLTGPDGRCARMLPDLVLVETKSRHGRSELDRLLWRTGVRPLTLSKYAVGAVLTRDGLPDQPWRPALRRAFPADRTALDAAA
ncbi:MAG: hypothetical protein JWO60_160 [Frankiales bacterium]|nr:hypothetical protein [Frankiales bacterium]